MANVDGQSGTLFTNLNLLTLFCSYHPRQYSAKGEVSSKHGLFTDLDRRCDRTITILIKEWKSSYTFEVF